MATQVINKVNCGLRLFYWQNKFLDIPLHRLLCNAVTQPFFEHTCNAWYPNLNKNEKRFHRLLRTDALGYAIGDRKSYYKKLEKINWLPFDRMVNQFILSCIYKLHAKKASNCVDKIFSHAECNGIPTCYS